MTLLSETHLAYPIVFFPLVFFLSSDTLNSRISPLSIWPIQFYFLLQIKSIRILFSCTNYNVSKKRKFNYKRASRLGRSRLRVCNTRKFEKHWKTNAAHHHQSDDEQGINWWYTTGNMVANWLKHSNLCSMPQQEPKSTGLSHLSEM